jgi:hypothetical protein
MTSIRSTNHVLVKHIGHIHATYYQSGMYFLYPVVYTYMLNMHLIRARIKNQSMSIDVNWTSCQLTIQQAFCYRPRRTSLSARVTNNTELRKNVGMNQMIFITIKQMSF